jgi:DEAD/DEAH box helicase
MLELAGGCEVAIATPGRLIELARSGACNLQRVTLLVIDEVDRCLDLGFEPQVMSVVQHVRPDRQTLLFSATLPSQAMRVVRAATRHDAVRVTVGITGMANAAVTQSVLLMANADQKMQWLEARLSSYVSEGDVLVFANQRGTVDALVGLLQACTFVQRTLSDLMLVATVATVATQDKQWPQLLDVGPMAGRGISRAHAYAPAKREKEGGGGCVEATWLHDLGREGAQGKQCA